MVGVAFLLALFRQFFFRASPVNFLLRETAARRTRLFPLLHVRGLSSAFAEATDNHVRLSAAVRVRMAAGADALGGQRWVLGFLPGLHVSDHY